MLGTSRGCVSKAEGAAVVGSETATCGTTNLAIAKSFSEDMPAATATVFACSCEGEDCNKGLVCPCAPKQEVEGEGDGAGNGSVGRERATVGLVMTMLILYVMYL